MTCVLNIGRQGARESTLLALIGAPEVMEDYMMHARSRCDARRRAVAVCGGGDAGEATKRCRPISEGYPSNYRLNSGLAGL